MQNKTPFCRGAIAAYSTLWQLKCRQARALFLLYQEENWCIQTYFRVLTEHCRERALYARLQEHRQCFKLCHNCFAGQLPVQFCFSTFSISLFNHTACSISHAPHVSQLPPVGSQSKINWGKFSLSRPNHAVSLWGVTRFVPRAK